MDGLIESGLTPTRSTGFAEGEVVAVFAGDGVGAGLEGHDAVIAESCGASPDEDVSVSYWDAGGLVGSLVSSEEKGCGQAEGYGDDGGVEAALVFVLVQGESRAGLVAIDEAGVGREAGESGCGCGAFCEVEEEWRHGRPGCGGVGVDGVVAVALAIGDPAEAAAVGHGD
jgi:hypothetical protein